MIPVYVVEFIVLKNVLPTLQINSLEINLNVATFLLLKS